MARGFNLLRGLKQQYNDPIVLEIDTSLGLSFRFGLGGARTNETSNGGAPTVALVDWGDGTTSYVAMPTNGSAVQPATRTYTSVGVYQVKIYGPVRSLTYAGLAAEAKPLKKIISWGHATLLSVITVGRESSLIEVPNYLPSKVVVLTGMFQNATAFNQNIGSWNTANVTAMGSMFSGAIAFNQNIGSWNTANVTTMATMFNGATAFNQDIGNWDVSKVLTFSSMFNGATNFNQSLANWRFNNSAIFTTFQTSSGVTNENYSKSLIGWANYIASTGDDFTMKGLTVSYAGKTATSTNWGGSPYSTGTDARTFLIGKDTLMGGSNSCCSSSDGTKMYIATSGGFIFTSSDSGTTWTQRASSGLWNNIACSSDGVKLVATQYGGQIYTSTDSGATWTGRDSNRNWIACASSSDGVKLVAAVSNGQIYTSTDSGATWTGRDSNRNWGAVASSDNGTKLVAVVTNGSLYTSTDSGATWTAQSNAGTRDWRGCASSSDGTKLVATVNNGQIYTSTDSGATWTARDSSRAWRGCASSADGVNLVAVQWTGAIYTSTNSGSTWTARTGPGTNLIWGFVTCSSDGTKILATQLAPGSMTGASPYRSEDGGVNWTRMQKTSPTGAGWTTP